MRRMKRTIRIMIKRGWNGDLHGSKLFTIVHYETILKKVTHSIDARTPHKVTHLVGYFKRPGGTKPRGEHKVTCSLLLANHTGLEGPRLEASRADSHWTSRREEDEERIIHPARPIITRRDKT